MSDNPKFEVIDRRKFKAEEERESRQSEAQPEKPEPAPEPEKRAAGPRLVVDEARKEPASAAPEPGPDEMPPAPTAQESREQKVAYDASAQRIDDLIRAANPAAGPQPPMTFDHLVQQFYLTAMLQMGAGVPEGETPRIDIVGARTTVDLLGILAEKTKGNLTQQEQRNLEAVLYDVRMAFLELSKVISLQGVQAPPKPKR